MPVLKSYRNSAGHYILASVRGSVVTFQLTEEGHRNLAAVGIGDGDRFHLSLLADLTRKGDAFTGGRGISYHEAEQFEFNFDTVENEESKALFPACNVTGSFDDLHLVTYQDGGQMSARLLAPEAISSLSPSIHLSIPITILNLRTLESLELTGHVPQGCEAVKELRDWLQRESSAEWERIRRSRNPGHQPTLSLHSPDELELR